MIQQDQRRIGIELLQLWRGTWRRGELPFVGRSMAPLTDDAVGLVISYGAASPRIGQIVLTLQQSALTAHRVVSVVDPRGASRWETQGDSCIARDPESVTSEQVFGRVVALVENGGTRNLLGPFWSLADRWAAIQTLFLGRLLARVAPGTAGGRPAGLQRWALALHRRILRLVFLATRALERVRLRLNDWQVHAFRSPLWRLLAASGRDSSAAGGLLEPALREAERHGMALLLLRRLRHLDSLPGRIARQDFSRRQAVAALTQVRRRPRIEEVITTLRRLGIPHMAVKGFAQIFTLYRGDASREMRDVDLLVPAPRVDEARRALEDLGFRVALGTEDPDFPRHHHGAPQWDPASGLVVELHHEVVPARVLPAGLAEAFWRRAETVEFAAGPLLVPSREDRLLHLCLHLRLHRFLGCVRDVMELATLTEEDPPPWDWGRLEAVAFEAGCLSTLHAGLRLAVIACGAPVPEEFLEHLGGRLDPSPFRELRIRLLARHLTGPARERRGRAVAVARWMCKQLAPI